MGVLNTNIFLIGPMGVGKTTIGRKLAQKLKKNFLDSDHEIEKYTGNSISTIFTIEGENTFRQYEKNIISTLSTQENIILATGGGAILHPETRLILKKRGIVIYLHGAINEILQRVLYDKNRPLLNTKNPRSQLSKILKHRYIYYCETADLIIKIKQHSIEYLIKIILNRLEHTSSLKQSMA